VLDKMSVQRNILITGGSSGIGVATAMKFLTESPLTRVIVCSRSSSRLLKGFPDALPYINQRRLYLSISDLSEEQGCRNCIEEAAIEFDGKIDVLVNNAGAGQVGQQLGTADMASYDQLFALNVRAPFLLSQLALPYMKSGACIVNISSIAAQRPLAGMAPYCMTKAAIEMFTQTIALELAPRGIRVVCVAPGTIETSFHTNAGMEPSMAAAYYKASSKTHPIGRIGRPEDIANAIFFLSSEGASFITGTTLLVDGGRLLTSATAPQMVT
jgi:NAD(P)-dependent dehydrogenase (short-subunit alcohol dehydrogenase family)